MTSFRQLEQRYISVEVSLMEWNPTLDLIALASVTGEIFLHRLSWQKVWSIPYPGNKDELVGPGVTAMSWRPDGKILAYAYADGLGFFRKKLVSSRTVEETGKNKKKWKKPAENKTDAQN